MLPDLKSIYLPGALKMQGLAQNQAVCVVFCPAGPIIEYMPDAVKTPPKTAPTCSTGRRRTRNVSSTRARPIPAPAARSCKACPTS